MIDGKCESCRFYKPASPIASGQCRRRSKQVVLATSGGVYDSVWPEVGESDWCGEYEPEQKPAEGPTGPEILFYRPLCELVRPNTAPVPGLAGDEDAAVDGEDAMCATELVAVDGRWFCAKHGPVDEVPLPQCPLCRQQIPRARPGADEWCCREHGHFELGQVVWIYG